MPHKEYSHPTLGDLIEAINDVTHDDKKTVSFVANLIRRGSVKIGRRVKRKAVLV